MTSQPIITPEAREWAEIFMDAHRAVEDDRELLALAFMELRAAPVRAGLTATQAKVLSFIEGYQAANRSAPSFADIQEAMGLGSKSTVHRLVHSLAERGAISLLHNRGRSIALIGRG